MALLHDDEGKSSREGEALAEELREVKDECLFSDGLGVFHSADKPQWEDLCSADLAPFSVERTEGARGGA